MTTTRTKHTLASLLSAANVQRVTVPLALLKPHPENYNEHPEEEIAGLIDSYRELGQYRSLVAIADPAEIGTYFTVAGNGFSEAMRQAEASEAFIDLLPPDTSRETVLAIMIADNEHARQSRANILKLTALLQEAQAAGHSLEAMGSSEEALQAMLEAEADKYLDKLPDEGDAEQEQIAEKWGIIIECEDEAEQVELLERLESEGHVCRALVL